MYAQIFTTGFDLRQSSSGTKTLFKTSDLSADYCEYNANMLTYIVLIIIKYYTRTNMIFDRRH